MSVMKTNDDDLSRVSASSGKDSTRCRVLCVSKTDRFDTSDAERFGDLIPMFSRAPSVLDPDSFLNEMSSKLDDVQFDPSIDMFCMTGSPMHLAYSLSLLCVKYEGPLKILIFHAGTSKYVLRLIDVDHSSHLSNGTEQT